MANDKYVNQAEKNNEIYDIRDARIPELEIENENSLRKTELNATGIENTFEREIINTDSEESIRLIDKAIYQSDSIEYTNIEGDNEKILNLQYPKLNGSKTFAISVNGVNADEEGNINITIPTNSTKLYLHLCSKPSPDYNYDYKLAFCSPRGVYFNQLQIGTYSMNEIMFYGGWFKKISTNQSGKIVSLDYSNQNVYITIIDATTHNPVTITVTMQLFFYLFIDTFEVISEITEGIDSIYKITQFINN